MVEQSVAWLDGFRRRTVRDERSQEIYVEFRSLAGSLTCDAAVTRYW